MLSDINSPAFLFYLLNFGFVSLIMYYCYLFYSRLKHIHCLLHRLFVLNSLIAHVLRQFSWTMVFLRIVLKKNLAALKGPD